jgi:predicted nucleic acid-binding protein
VYILDSSVLVTLAHRDAFATLSSLAGPALVPDIVDDELSGGAKKHPVDHGRYQAARDAGLFRIEPLKIGTAAYAEYLRLRKLRVSPARNRGEDACIALALTLPGSHIYVDDSSAANRARTELKDPTRIVSSAQLLSR